MFVLQIASNAMDKTAVPDLSKTTPAAKIGPHPTWWDPEKIVTLDPFGHCVLEAFPEHFAKGYDIRPTIAGACARLPFIMLCSSTAAGT